MRLEKLHLSHFRTYTNLDLDLPAKLTFVIGNNATGKTNIIEAISVLSVGKSFRGSPDADMIQHGCTDYFLRGTFEKQERRNVIEIGCDLSGLTPKRKIRINDRIVPGRSALIGRLTTVVFSPADINIVEGGPAQRRRFLDMVLSSRDEQYLETLIRYNRTLQQRNAALKRARQQKVTADLGVWDQHLIVGAEALIKRRQEFIAEFQMFFSESLNRISEARDQIELRLEPAVSGEFDNFAAALDRYAKRDRALGYTTVGPHRHALRFENAGRDVVQFASQGQRRSLVLALRMAQFRYLRDSLRVSPILLIDDVLRELDATRRKAFVQLLEESSQAVFTTPDLAGLADFPGPLREQAAVLKVIDQGLLEPQGFPG